MFFANHRIAQEIAGRFLDRTLLNSQSQVPEENERPVAEATRVDRNRDRAAEADPGDAWHVEL